MCVAVYNCGMVEKKYTLFLNWITIVTCNKYFFMLRYTDKTRKIKIILPAIIFIYKCD